MRALISNRKRSTEPFARRKIICICGPICSGKSVLARDIAESLNFEGYQVAILDDPVDSGHVANVWKEHKRRHMSLLIITVNDMVSETVSFLRKGRFKGRVQFINMEAL